MDGKGTGLFSSFSRRLAGFILILLMFLIIGLIIFWYTGSLSTIDQDFSHRQNLTDQVLRQSVIWIDRGISLYELQYIPSLKDTMYTFQKKYRQSGGDISKIDLNQLKQEVEEESGGKWDFYLIDQEGKVIQTTYTDDAGLDFKIWPSFYQRVTEIRINGSFVPDRTVKGYAKDAPYRKFAYMGTPDGRYLLEISRSFDRLIPQESGASYKELIHNLPLINPDIISVELYNKKYEVVSQYPATNQSKKSKPEQLAKVISVFSDKKEIIENDPETGSVVRYTYLPINDSESPSASEMYLVSKTTYSPAERDRQKVSLILLLLGLLILTITVAFISAIAGSRYLSRPINRIVEDMNMIAAGDLDHPIRPSGSSEFEQIEKATTLLVSNLKETISNLKTREEELLDELSKRWRAEENYRRLFNSAREAIFILNTTTIQSCNAAASVLLKRPVEAIVGKELHEFSADSQQNTGDPKTRLHEIITRVIQGELFNTEWNLVRSDGIIIEADVQCSAILSGDNIVVMAIFRDITELKEMRKREITAITQIEENLVKLASINDQIRNPLASITILNELQGGAYEAQIYSQITTIDSLINEVDKNFVKTDKVRLFLMKHYGLSGTDDSADNP